MFIWTVISSLFVLAITWTIVCIIRNSRRFKIYKKLGIKSPKPWPGIGDLPAMISEGFMEFQMRLYKEYDSEKVFGINDLQKCVIVFKDLDLIRDVCVKHFNSFPNRRVFFDKEPFENIMTVIKDDHWRNVRTSVSPTFSSGKLKRMFRHIDESSQILVSNLGQSCKEGKEIELKELMSYYSMDVIASTGFGLKLDSLNDKSSEFVAKAKSIISGFSGSVLVFALLFPSLTNLLQKIGIDIMPNKSARYFHKFVDEAIANRQKEESSSTKRYDFLQLVINAEVSSDGTQETSDSVSGQYDKKGLKRSDIQGTSLIFFLAGYETVSIVLSFAVFLLAHNPKSCKKLQEELDRVLDGQLPTYERVQELTYLDMCFNETMRLYPPGFVIDRECVEDCTIQGIHIAKGTIVMFPVMAIHRDPKLWPDPENFNPERFSAENKESRHSFAHMPFGQGPRSCIAMRLALLEIKVAVAAILQQMTPVPCEKSAYPPVLMKSQMKASGGLWVKFVPRQT